MTKESQRTIWILTDGKIGDLVQCRAVASGVGGKIEERVISPSGIWATLMPFGPIDPAEAPDKPESPIAGPYPDVVIASGRRTVPYIRKINKITNRKTFTIFLKNPVVSYCAFDFVWAPEHDEVTAKSVFSTWTSPHAFNEEAFEKARQNTRSEIAGLPGKKLALIIGGNGKSVKYEGETLQAFAKAFSKLNGFDSLMVTTSRRTPPQMIEKVKELIAPYAHFFLDGQGDNPYTEMLANADAIFVTGDSHNMVSECVSTSAPIYVFNPKGNARKFSKFLAEMHKQEALTVISEESAETVISETKRAPINSTPQIIAAILEKLAR